MNYSHQAATSTSMAMAMALFFFFNSAAYSEVTVFKVGDGFGWQQPTTNTTTQLYYTHWATNHRFQVGDSLLFEYKNDSVAEVDKWGYSQCNASTSKEVFDDGNSSFVLEKPGPFYFISGNFGHCQNGMLLLVEVMHQCHHDSMAPDAEYGNPPEGSSSESSPSSSMEPRQPSSAVIVSVIVSSVTVVLIATFIALAWCSP